MKKLQHAAVIGHPIGHTMSPFIQKKLFELATIPMEYEVLDIPDLEKAMPKLLSLDCFNITIPHKSAILPYLAEVCEQARLCGSVNTVTVKDGKLYGATSDGAGALLALSIHGETVENREILLLGNGGAAKALAFAVAEFPNFHLTIAHRAGSAEKAEQLAQALRSYAEQRGDTDSAVTLLAYEELEHRAQSGQAKFDLLMNATSVGMYPNTGKSPVSSEVVSCCGAVFDVVYNPKETELLKLAKQAGVKAIGGMGMLVCQAAYSHKVWYGTKFQREDLLTLIDDANDEMQRVFGGGHS